MRFGTTKLIHVRFKRTIEFLEQIDQILIKFDNSNEDEYSYVLVAGGTRYRIFQVTFLFCYEIIIMIFMLRKKEFLNEGLMSTDTIRSQMFSEILNYLEQHYCTRYKGFFSSRSWFFGFND